MRLTEKWIKLPFRERDWSLSGGQLTDEGSSSSQEGALSPCQSSDSRGFAATCYRLRRYKPGKICKKYDYVSSLWLVRVNMSTGLPGMLNNSFSLLHCRCPHLKLVHRKPMLSYQYCHRALGVR